MMSREADYRVRGRGYCCQSTQWFRFWQSINCLDIASCRVYLLPGLRKIPLPEQQHPVSITQYALLQHATCLCTQSLLEMVPEVLITVLVAHAIRTGPMATVTVVHDSDAARDTQRTTRLTVPARGMGLGVVRDR